MRERSPRNVRFDSTQPRERARRTSAQPSLARCFWLLRGQTRHVINLVIDNWAQWFVVVPGAVNLVQGPSNYEALLRMGVPAHQVGLGCAPLADDTSTLTGACLPSSGFGMHMLHVQECV